jgi:dihydrodiol dehydrogenase / D-xylose 1-dehydrogenase (NADP)
VQAEIRESTEAQRRLKISSIRKRHFYTMATRWGIASCGLISQDFVSSLKSTPFNKDHKVVACAARSLEKAEEFAKRFDIAKAFAGYEALAQDPNVEVVYVGAINPAHIGVCKLMINAGE